MNDIAALEARITAALDRISIGVAKQAGSGGDADLASALATEQDANAQLQERVKLLKERQDGKITELEARVASQQDQMAQLNGERQKMRTAMSEMSATQSELRDAAASGAVDPELINRALMAEVEALTAQRGADASEVAAILSELKPLIEEA